MPRVRIKPKTVALQSHHCAPAPRRPQTSIRYLGLLTCLHATSRCLELHNTYRTDKQPNYSVDNRDIRFVTTHMDKNVNWKYDRVVSF